MKPTAFIFPFAIILAGAIWFGLQTRTISRIEQENALLSERIKARTSRPDTLRTTGTTQKSGIDWNKALEEFAAAKRTGLENHEIRLTGFEARTQSMSTSELIAAFNEMAAIHIPGMSRSKFKAMLINALFEKDPELALSRFIGRRTEDGVGDLSRRFARCADKDPVKATSWLDQQIANQQACRSGLGGAGEASGGQRRG